MPQASVQRAFQENMAHQPASALLKGIGVAVPGQRFTQEEIFSFLSANLSLSTRSQSIYQKALTHPSIKTRHLSLDSLAEILHTDLDLTRSRFESKGAGLAARAFTAALRNAELSANKINFVSVATCTGYLCPGISSYLVEQAGLSSSVRTVDIAGMGCGAAVPAMEQAANFVKANPGSIAAAIAVEVCSNAFLDSDDPAQIISNALFGDGAAAVILSGDEEKGESSLARLLSFESLQKSEWRECLRFTTQNGYLKNVLDKSVPAKAAQAMDELSKALLAKHGLSEKDIPYWVLHAGGDKVLSAMQKKLRLSDAQLAPSRRVLENYGNMSSPTVLFVLHDVLSQYPARKSKGILASFGAGFSAHAALLEFPGGGENNSRAHR